MITQKRTLSKNNMSPINFWYGLIGIRLISWYKASPENGGEFTRQITIIFIIDYLYAI